MSAGDSLVMTHPIGHCAVRLTKQFILSTNLLFLNDISSALHLFNAFTSLQLALHCADALNTLPRKGVSVSFLDPFLFTHNNNLVILLGLVVLSLA